MTQAAVSDPHKTLTRENLSLWLIFSMIAGIHTGISITSGGQLIVPFVISGLSAAFALFFQRKMVDRKVVIYFIIISASILLFGLIGTVFDGYPVKRINASTQFLYSLMIGYAFFLCVANVRQERVTRLFLIMSIGLILCAGLEVVGILKPASDWFRQVANTWRPVYWNDYRDIVEYGGIRPKVFAQEPSVLGISITFCVVLWYLTARTKSFERLLVAVALSAVSYELVKSTTLILGVLVCTMYFVVLAQKDLVRRRQRAVWVGILAAIGTVAIPLGAININSVTPGATYTKTASFFGREIAPPLITSRVLLRRPALGIGFGGWETARPEFYNVYGSEGSQYNTAYQFSISVDKTGFARIPDLRYMITNAFWEYWLIFGLGGGILVLFLLNTILRLVGATNSLLVFSATAFFAQTMGGIGAPTPWIIFAGMAAASTFSAYRTGAKQ